MARPRKQGHRVGQPSGQSWRTILGRQSVPTNPTGHPDRGGQQPSERLRQRLNPPAIDNLRSARIDDLPIPTSSPLLQPIALPANPRLGQPPSASIPSHNRRRSSIDGLGTLAYPLAENCLFPCACDGLSHAIDRRQPRADPEPPHLPPPRRGDSSSRLSSALTTVPRTHLHPAPWPSPQPGL